MKFEDIKPGMLLPDGLVLRTIPAGTTNFYKDDNAITLFCIHDPYMGPISHVYHDDDVTELHPMYSLEYVKAVEQMLKTRLRAAFDAQEDARKLQVFIDRSYDALRS